MKVTRIIPVVALGCLFGLQPAFGQKSTELYIPIGKSPGLSGKHTSIGKIEKVDIQKRMITVGVQGGVQSVQITDQTRIWIDRSSLRQANINGSMGDLQVGRRVEVKYLSLESRTDAEWIKVEAPGTVKSP